MFPCILFIGKQRHNRTAGSRFGQCHCQPLGAQLFRQYLLDKGVTLIDSREGTTYQINK